MRLNSNNKFSFDFNDVIDILVGLSHSQGFYGRLLRDLSEMKEYEPERFELIVAEIESQNFTSPLDVILYFEG